MTQRSRNTIFEVGGLETFMDRLDEEGLSLLIIKDGESVYASGEGGMAPLLEAIDHLGLDTLVDSTVVDKIVGKAAALLIAFFRAKEVYTKLLSGKAIKVLKRHEITYLSEKVVSSIRNRDGTDICPFERIVLKIEDPQKGYKKLKEEYTRLIRGQKRVGR